MTQLFEFQIFGGRPTHHSNMERVYYHMEDSLHSRGAFGGVFPLVDPGSRAGYHTASLSPSDLYILLTENAASQTQ